MNDVGIDTVHVSLVGTRRFLAYKRSGSEGDQVVTLRRHKTGLGILLWLGYFFDSFFCSLK